MGEIHAYLLNRQATFSQSIASCFVNGPRTFPTIHGQSPSYFASCTTFECVCNGHYTQRLDIA